MDNLIVQKYGGSSLATLEQIDFVAKKVKKRLNDANKIVIKYKLSSEEKLLNFEDDTKVYDLIKFQKTNQGSCINLKPIPHPQRSLNG